MKYNLKFYQFAGILYSIVGGKKYDFTIDLLKGGLDDSGVEYIKSLKTDNSGKDRIRKFLSGERDITEIAPEIVTSYYERLFAKYLDEILDENKYCEVCNKFKASPYYIYIDEHDLSKTLAKTYRDILEEAAIGKRIKNPKTKKNQRRKSRKLTDIAANDKKQMLGITHNIIHCYDEIKQILEGECSYIAMSKETGAEEDQIREGLKAFDKQLVDQFVFFNTLNLDLISFRSNYPDRDIAPLVDLANAFCEFELYELSCTISNNNPKEYHFSDVMNNYESALVAFRDFICDK